MFVEISVLDRPDRPPTVAVRGELDLASADQLRAELDRVSEAQPDLLVVDLSGTTFVDSSGLGAIAGGLRSQRRHGGALRVVGVSPPVRKVFEISGLAGLLVDDDPV